MAHNFNHQTNITLGESIKMGIKAPALEDRIFDTWSDANTYIHDENSSAVNGLVLTVINDGDNNGGWFVDKAPTSNNQYELILRRLNTGNSEPEFYDINLSSESDISNDDCTIYNEIYNDCTCNRDVEEIYSNILSGKTVRITFTVDGEIIYKNHISNVVIFDRDEDSSNVHVYVELEFPITKMMATNSGTCPSLDTCYIGNVTISLYKESNDNTIVTQNNTVIFTEGDIKEVAFTGDYNDLENTPDIPAPQIQSDWNQTDTNALDYIKNKPDVESLENGEFPGDWRTPTADELTYIINTRPASTVSGTVNARFAKAQINSINGLILLPDVFELPTGITMININTGSATASDNTYTISQWETLENAGCIFLPCSGYRNGTYMSNINSFGFYSSTTQQSSNDIRYLYIHSGYDGVGILTDSKQHGKCVRLIKENTTGSFSISSTLKADIAKSNLQFHCLNKEWRFAPNSYDVIGNDNSNIAENYNGYIDLFGFGTSGWNSGAVAYQPWSASTNDNEYIAHDLTGDYANADWGVYNIKKQLQPVAFTGDYNDLVNKPTIPAAQVQADWNQTDTTAPDYIKNKPDVASLEDNVEELQEDVEELQSGYFIPGWRTPTSAEWEFLINTRSASTVGVTANARYVKAQVNSVNGLILLPDIFTLPSGISIGNINSSGAAYTSNTYTITQLETLEAAGCIFLPCTGYRVVTTINSATTCCDYWASTSRNATQTYGIWVIESEVNAHNVNEKYGGSAVRVIKNNPNGSFSFSTNTKGDIAKSNLQFHCLNKKWRFAPNSYDAIGTANSNIAENYNGWIDLFGWGTSGWNSGATCYQPWSTSNNNSDYLSQSITGDYKNADWGVFATNKQLQPVAFSGSYNDLSDVPLGEAGGIAELDSYGKVPSSQLPSYVDDVIEGYLYNNHFYEDSAHTILSPSDQESGKIFVDLEYNLSYRWSGSTYVEVSQSLALGETSSTAYRGDRGKTAYDHATDANRVTTAQSSGLYKIAVTSEGHVASVTPVVASDIPLQDATETQKGVAELATSAEAITGTDTERIVTPKTNRDAHDAWHWFGTQAEFDALEQGGQLSEYVIYHVEI